MAGFEIWHNGKKDRELPLGTSEIVIGRDPAVSLRLDGDGVSRRHARVFGREGRWIAEDLGTRNGMHVNGVREFSKPLRDGDRVQISDWVLVFRSTEDEQVPEAPRKIQTRRERAISSAITSIIEDEPGTEDEEAEMATSVVTADVVARMKAEVAGTRVLDSRDAAKLRLNALTLLGPHLRLESAGSRRIVRLAPLPFEIGPDATAKIRTTWRPWFGRAVIEATISGRIALRWRGLWPRVTVNGRIVRRRVLVTGDVVLIEGSRYSFQAGEPEATPGPN